MAPPTKAAALLLLILLNLVPRLLALRATQSLERVSPTVDSSTPAPVKATTAGEPFIKKMRFQVPESARLGSTVRLSCAYELSGASLHAMKLFKDDKEFYRFTPAGQPAADSEQRIAFGSPGLRVDLARSNEQDIWIKVLDKRAAGTYKCQVSIEDTFKSISAEKRLDVIERARATPAQLAGGGASSSAAASSAWLAASSSSSSSSSLPAQQHHKQHSTVQQNNQAKNRAQASFMRPPTSSAATHPASDSASRSGRLLLGAVGWSFAGTMLVAVIISSQSSQHRQEIFCSRRTRRRCRRRMLHD